MSDLLDFYFQLINVVKNMDDFLQNLTIELTGTIIGSFVAARYALKQYKKQNNDRDLQQKVEENKLNVNKIRYLNHLIHGSLEFATKLKERLNEIIENFKEDDYTIDKISMDTWDDLLRIVKLTDRELHYHAYKQIIQDENLNVIFSDLDKLNRIRKYIIQLYKIHNIEYYKNTTSLQLQHVELVKLHENIEEVCDKSKALKIELKKHADIYGATCRKNDWTDYLNLLLNPIQKSIEDIYPLKKPLLINDLYFKVINQTVIFKNIKSNNLVIINDLKRQIDLLNDIINSISFSVTAMDKFIYNQDLIVVSSPENSTFLK